MSIFTADNVVVSGPSGLATSASRVSEWVANIAYSDSQIVTFNGSQYVARGSVGAGLIPSIEVSTPQVPGQPKWFLACRGRSLPVEYSDTATYYADQVILFLGGVYILDAATVPVGTRPNRDKRFTRMSETLTDAESERVTSADLSAFAVASSVVLVSNSDESPRVRHHRVRLTMAGLISPGNLYTLRFPRPLGTEARPQITVHVEDQLTSYMLLTGIPTFSGTQVSGYIMTAQGGGGPGSYEFDVFVKEMIDQVK